MSEDFAEPNDKKSRYEVMNHPSHGYVMISRRDGQNVSHLEYKMIRNMLAVALRAEQIGIERSNAIEQKTDFDIDEIVMMLGYQHKARRIPFSHFSKVIGVHITTLTEVFKGKRRAYLDLVRPWAYFMGFDIMAVPMPLKSAVRALVAAWMKENAVDTAFFRDVEGEFVEEGGDGQKLYRS